MLTDLIAFLTWYLAAAAAGLAALPLSYRFFQRLPDRGYAFAKPFGVLLVGYFFWLLSSFGIVFNDAGGVTAAAVLTAAIGLFWLGRGGRIEMGRWIRENRHYVIAVEVLFLAAFALWSVIRAYNPDIYGTEKPMEFMFINSILRSPDFPPHDAWLSGHAISYYYFGYVLISAFIFVTNVPASLAFNLGIAMLFALTAVSALAVMVNLIGLVRKVRPENCFGAALLGPLLVLVVGNYFGALELAHINGAARDLRVPAVYYDFGQLGEEGQVLQQPGARAGLINFWEWLDLKTINDPPQPRQGSFRWGLNNWFFAARVVHDRSLVGVETEAIDENPAFSFLLADMHPHVLALPFVILVIGAALSWLMWSWGSGAHLDAGIGWPSWQRMIISAILIGGLAFLNTWDFPIYYFLTGLALVFGAGAAHGWDGLRQIWPRLALILLALAVLSILLYLPFYLTLQSQAGGVLPNLIYPTRFQQIVVNFGPVMAGVILFMVWVIVRFRPWIDLRAALLSGLGVTALLAVPVFGAVILTSVYPPAGAVFDRWIYPLSRQEAASLFWQRRIVDSMATIFPAVLLGLSTGLAVGLLKPRKMAEAESETVDSSEQAAVQVSSNPHNQPPLLFQPAGFMLLAMAITSALLLLGPEFVYLRDYFGTRMNTIFKFYFQVWVLWALLGGTAIWWVYQNLRSLAGKAAVWLSVAAILPGLIYLPGSLIAKTGSFSVQPTLDGMAYFAASYPNEWAAIEWFNEYVDGRPVILEGSRGSYWIEGRSSRISMATGLPTLLGWRGHEEQWRGEYFTRVLDRVEHISQIYQFRSWQDTQPLLDRYEIRYIIVSPLERDWYNPVFIPKFDLNLQKVFESGSLVIYYYPGGR
jgi:YYY domain-containing protein